MTFKSFRSRITDLMGKFSCEYEDDDKVEPNAYVVQDIMEVIEDLEEEDE